MSKNGVTFDKKKSGKDKLYNHLLQQFRIYLRRYRQYTAAEERQNSKDKEQKLVEIDILSTEVCGKGRH